MDISSRIKLVGYNATLQGGVFHDKDPHSFTQSDLNNIVFEHKLGINLMRHWIQLGMAANYTSQEFIDAKSHLYGTFKATFLL